MKASMPGKNIAAEFIQENFEPGDRLAVVLLNKRMGGVIQRVASAEKMAASDFQAWLRHKNAERFEVYVSMNALQESAKGRTKGDVAAIRHVFLDFDEDGTAAIQKLIARDDLPRPNYLVNTSPDKWQVSWKVEGFTAEAAEHLQRALARETGADIAATDSARVLRLPGFYNHKYSRRYMVTVETHSHETHRPEHFPRPTSDGQARNAHADSVKRPKGVSGERSQSERDWAYAKRALNRGESPELIIAAIATHRSYDKHDPQYYAELTVGKAARALGEALRAPTGTNDHDR